ncbi:MAG: DsbA family protein [Acidimicrobiales bacterium]|nr:DsbA family protein [Acidimicrobiales bacterium]
MPATSPGVKCIDVFADVTCPFAHVGLRRIMAERDARGRRDVTFRVRAWPLERVNGHAESGADLQPKVVALQGSVAPELFRSFDPATFPTSSLRALAWEAAAHAVDVQVGEQFSALVRTALFEDGADIASERVLTDLGADLPVSAPNEERVLRDWEEGQRRGVEGSPHFFVDDADFFCPSMSITREGGRLDIEFDEPGFTAFLDRCLA